MGLHMDIDGFGGMLIEQWIWMYVNITVDIN